MLTDLLILALVAVAALVTALVRTANARIAAHGALFLVLRWLTGHPWHGKAITDAGWFRPGTKAFTQTGHAPRFHYRPRWQRMAHRTGKVVAAILLILLWVNYPHVAGPVTILSALALIAYWAWRALRKFRRRKHRRTWMEPLHLVAAPQVGIPIANAASSWLSITPDRDRVVAELPPGFNPDAKEKERLINTFVTKLGIEAPDVKWQLAGPEPKLELTASQPPPDVVTLGGTMPAIEAARPDELVWGIGKRAKVVKNSLSGDSPHVALSMGSGAGKSRTARAILAQMLYHGAIGLVLDYKMISHQWARELPNVVIARRPAEIHNALLWLGRELERRNEVALAGSDDEGNVHAVVGPRIIVVCEEMNATMSRLRKHWNQVREKDDPKRSPALDALDAVSFMGRQVMCNVVYIAQRFSVKAAGGDGDARENVGVIAFSRYTPSNWKMLAGEHPMPPKSLTPGRLQVVASGVTEVQAINMSAREAKQLALAGTVAQLPAGMPGARHVTGADLTQISGPDLGVVTDTHPAPITAGPQLVTLSEAVSEGIVSCSLAALRIARHRGNGFPDPTGQRGLAHEYDPLKLAEWDAGRR